MVVLVLFVSEKEAAQALRKEHVPMEPPTDAIISAVDTQNISAKEYNAAKKASSASAQAFPFPMEDNAAEEASSASAQAFPFPPIGSSGKTCEINLTYPLQDSRHLGVLIVYENFIYGFHSALKNFH